MSTDVTQAYYLTQNHLWEELFPGCVEEYVDSIEKISLVSNEKMLHIPYWKLWEMRNCNLNVDIMVANHCLTEMHQWALRFYLAFGRWLMRNSQYKLFIAQAPGSLHSGNIPYLLRCFEEMGYALLYTEKDFVIFCLKDRLGVEEIDIEQLLQNYNGRDHFPIHKDSKDKTITAFNQAVQKIAEQKKVSLQEIEDYFYSLDSHVASPDEEFIDYCNVPML